MQTLCQIIEKLIISKRYGVFNIGCKGGVSKFEFGKIVANKLKLDNKLIKKYKSYYKINRRPLNTIVSLEKIQKILNFKFTSLEDNFTDKEII